MFPKAEKGRRSTARFQQSTAFRTIFFSTILIEACEKAMSIQGQRVIRVFAGDSVAAVSAVFIVER